MRHRQTAMAKGFESRTANLRSLRCIWDYSGRVNLYASRQTDYPFRALSIAPVIQEKIS